MSCRPAYAYPPSLGCPLPLPPLAEGATPPVAVDGGGGPAPDGGGERLPEHGAEPWDRPRGMREEGWGDPAALTAAEFAYEPVAGRAYGAKSTND